VSFTESDVFLGDSYEILKLLPKGFFQLILTDPPYKISRANNFQTMGREGFDWEWDRDFDPITWITFCADLLAPGGSLLSTMDWKLLGQLSAAGVSSGLVEKDPIIWEKNNPQPRNINRRYVSDKEFGVWLVKPGAKWTFNRISENYERSRFTYPVPHVRKHATKKSEKLWEDLVRIHSNPGDWILDPFCGEGTTGVVAKRLGRSSIQIEKNEQHHTWAVEALQGA